MLVLSRKLQEAIVINGDIVIRILEVNRDTVKIGIEAAPEVPVHRSEVADAQERKRKRNPK